MFFMSVVCLRYKYSLIFVSFARCGIPDHLKLMSDKEILELYRSGEHQRAFNEIVGAYSERLYWHVRTLVCSHEDADDLMQDIFVKVWTSLQTFRGDSQLYTWLYRIATNEAMNFLNKKRVRAALSFESLSDTLERKVEDDPYFNGNEAERLLNKAIQRLPQKQKAVFCMRYYQELSYEDMSEILGTSVGALKASYHFAYEKIKKELQEKMPDSF